MDQRTVWLTAVIVISVLGGVGLIISLIAGSVCMKCAKPEVHDKVVEKVRSEKLAEGEMCTKGEIEECYQRAMWIFASIQKWGMLLAALAVLALIIITVIATSNGVI